MSYDIIYKGNVREFEQYLLDKAEQEFQQRGHRGMWCQLTDTYVRQLKIIMEDPFPPAEADTDDDEDLPSIKHLTVHVTFDNFFRWGLRVPRTRTGNHRIIFAIHNYHKVVLLHHFDKQYNGVIKLKDIKPAEAHYEDYCVSNPSY